MLLKNFIRCTFYHKDAKEPAKLILTMHVNDKPLAWLSYNEQELDSLIATLKDMKSKFHDIEPSEVVF